MQAPFATACLDDGRPPTVFHQAELDVNQGAILFNGPCGTVAERGVR